MKKILIAFLLFSGACYGQVEWMTMNEALEAQKTEPRKILLKAYTDWCGICKWMDKHAFAKAGIAQFINDNYYPVAFNAEGEGTVSYKGKTFNNPDLKRNYRSQHEFAELLNIMEYPTLVFFDEKGEVINPIPGKMDARKLEIYLTMLVDDTYKEINTGKKWRDYQKNFVYKLQG